MNNFKTDKTFLMLKSESGKVKHVDTQVNYSWEIEEESIEGSFDFGSEKENEEYLKKFESGEYISVFLTVTVEALGQVGIDSLGMIHVKNDSTIEDQLIQTAIEHDMKNNACLELAANITYQWNQLKKVFLED